MPASASAISQLQAKVWSGHLPLEIRLAASDCRSYDQADPYLINVPRLSYLPFIFPRLHAFFSSSLIDPTVAPHEAWLSFEGVPLKWHYPVGLLYDLHCGMQADSDEQDLGQEEGNGDVIPWKITLHFTDYPLEKLMRMDEEYKVLLDTFINSVKEADFIRNGTAKVAMGMSKSDSVTLLNSIQTHNLTSFNSVNNKFLNPPGSALRHTPIKLYLPSAPPETDASTGEAPQAGRIRVVQSLVAPLTPSRQVVTLGQALKTILPAVFPSPRNPVLARPVMHGAMVPMSAPVEELLRAASYTDGFLHIAVMMLG
ncbi:hypothetical protein AAFC00_003634 [Neodothiora populina]|uniref:Autophagy protein 5 n=1 Tax=Neodothiora populina TaxID=2781224 RepID=A0ABR3PEU9_9PEZI